MWNRADIKSRGKELFRRNYWKAVAAALLASLLMTGFGGAASYTGAFNGMQNQESAQDPVLQDGNEYFDEFYGYNNKNSDDAEDIIENIAEGRQGLPGSFGALAGGVTAAVLVVIFLVIFVIAMAFMFVYTAFIANPIETGMQKFFITNESGNAKVGELGYAFDSNYKNIATVMFFRTLYVFLWTLLFIIPGIVKSYEYRMIPYILAENPNLSKEEAFGISRAMMTGNKMKAFIFDLSFLGWFILSAFTLGVLGTFYVNPYYYQSCALLYEAIKGEYTNVVPGA